VDGHAGNVTTANLHFTNVDAGTDLDPQRVHRGDNRCWTVDRHTRAAEERQKSVADGVNFTAAEALDHRHHLAQILGELDLVLIERSVTLGAEVTELIQGFVIAMNCETTEEELMNSIFPHPTLSEMMKEAVLDAYGRVLNI